MIQIENPPQELIERARAGDLEARDEIVGAALPLIEAEASRFAGSRPGVEAEELVTPAFVGVLDAIRTYDPERGAAFVAHARRRVRGALLDQARAQGHVRRPGLEAFRQVEAAKEAMRQDLGREPASAELEDAVGDAALFARAQEAAAALAPRLPSDPPGAGLDAELQAELAERVRLALWRLPARDRVVFDLRYRHGIPMAEIGRGLGISEGRVSQLLKRSRERALADPRRGSPPGGHKQRRRQTQPIPDHESRVAGALAGRSQGGRVAFGYRRLHRLVFPHGGEAPVVRLIFERYLEDPRGVPGVTEWLNESDHKPRRGRKWWESSVYKTLTNDFYLGTVRYGEVRAEGRHAPLIEESLWQAVQARLRSRSTRLRR